MHRGSGDGPPQEDYVQPYLRSMERSQRLGVYFIFKTLEPGPTFSSCLPHFPYQGPRLPHPQKELVSLYPLLLVHSRPGAGPIIPLWRFFHALLDPTLG